jgi:hypothetical protein
MTACFECGEPATCEHHVIPRSRGGTKTVPLCGGCHGLAHGLNRATWSDHPALTSAAMARLKASGRYTGGQPPYGYRVDTDGGLCRDDSECATMEVATSLRAAGLSLRQIGLELTSRGMTTRGGGKWYASAVSRVLESAGGAA